MLELLTAKFQAGELLDAPESSKNRKAGGAGVESWKTKSRPSESRRERDSALVNEQRQEGNVDRTFAIYGPHLGVETQFEQVDGS